MIPNKPTMSRRGYLGATGGVLAGLGMAGCLNSTAAAGLTELDDFDLVISAELEGEGPGEEVTVSLDANGEEFERTITPGEELEAEISEFEGENKIELTYDETIALELEWSRPGITLNFELEQEQWKQTSGEIGISLADDQLTTDVELALTLPGSATQVTGSDTRTVREGQEYQVDLEVSAEDGETEAEFEVEWEDADSDDVDDADDAEAADHDGVDDDESDHTEADDDDD